MALNEPQHSPSNDDEKSSSAVLHILDQQHNILHSVPLKHGRSVLGRKLSEIVTVEVNFESVSKEHIVIEFEKNGLMFVEDMNSTNKTRLIVQREGDRFAKQLTLIPNRLYQIQSGNVLMLGSVPARVEIIDSDELVSIQETPCVRNERMIAPASRIVPRVLLTSPLDTPARILRVNHVLAMQTPAPNTARSSSGYTSMGQIADSLEVPDTVFTHNRPRESVDSVSMSKKLDFSTPIGGDLDRSHISESPLSSSSGQSVMSSVRTPSPLARQLSTITPPPSVKESPIAVQEHSTSKSASEQKLDSEDYDTDIDDDIQQENAPVPPESNNPAAQETTPTDVIEEAISAPQIAESSTVHAPIQTSPKPLRSSPESTTCAPSELQQISSNTEVDMNKPQVNEEPMKVEETTENKDDEEEKSQSTSRRRKRRIVTSDNDETPPPKQRKLNRRESEESTSNLVSDHPTKVFFTGIPAAELSTLQRQIKDLGGVVVDDGITEELLANRMTHLVTDVSSIKHRLHSDLTYIQ